MTADGSISLPNEHGPCADASPTVGCCLSGLTRYMLFACPQLRPAFYCFLLLPTASYSVWRCELAHDCRRPALFRPEVLAAIDLYARGDLDPATTTGAWAGEIGQVQMLPADIRDLGLDGDGDGHVTLKTSPADALLSGAHVLSSLGWQPGAPWLQEVVVPADLDWALTGLDSSLTVAEWAARGVVAREGDLHHLHEARIPG